MNNRYEVKRGRFGAYFFDNLENKEMDLAETVCALNVMHQKLFPNAGRKISNNAESQINNTQQAQTKITTEDVELAKSRMA